MRILIYLCLSAFCFASEIQVIQKGKEKRVSVFFDGELFTEYRYDNFKKPILYPVIGPHGIAMTRHFPMKKNVEGEAKDHPHHQSIHYNHPVNGNDFWHGRRGERIRNDKIEKATVENGEAVIIAKNSWVVKEKIIFQDRTEIRCGIDEKGRYIDYCITLFASHGDIRFENSKEGTMSIRTHPALRLKGAVAKGSAVNSEGVKGKAIWGKQAKWVDYWGLIEGKTVGISIFDHPNNPRHPTTWHARDYGLVTANPFGKRHFKVGKGAMRIKKGQSRTFKYRFFFHEGSPTSIGLNQIYENWANDSQKVGVKK